MMRMQAREGRLGRNQLYGMRLEAKNTACLDLGSPDATGLGYTEM